MNIDFILDNLMKHGDGTAVISDGEEYSFRDIYNEYKTIEKTMKENGIKQGHVVAIKADYTPISIAFMLALIKNDNIIVPLSKFLVEIDSFLSVSQANYFIDASDEKVIFKKLDNVINHKMILELQQKHSPGLILFSSGTTGEPKAALHDLTHFIQKFKRPGKVLRTITFLMFDHIGGFNTLFHALANGGTIVTISKREPEEICRAIETYKVELLPTSPTFINMLLLSGIYKKYDLSSLKIISYGTEPMPEFTLKQLHKLYPDIRLKQTYGLSEVGIMATKSEASDSLWMKLGGEGYETKIVDDILYIRSQYAMVGYLNAPSLFDEDGWFNTKDKVMVKGDYLKIMGRTTDLINVGGEKVYPIEIESVLLQLDGVLDARVLGKDNPITGKMVVADLMVKPENNNREFIKKARRFCKDRLETYKIPAKIRLTEENMNGDKCKKART